MSASFPTRILFVIDGRSPIALNWIPYFLNQGYEIHVVTTFACRPLEGVSSQEFIPVAFSSVKKKKGEWSSEGKSSIPRTIQSGLWGASSVILRNRIRHWLGWASLPGAASRLVHTIQRVQPDLIHAMRIPYEGMLTALALERLRKSGMLEPSFVISIWGNDLTLHAPSNFIMAAYTRKVLRKADGLHTDCRRDQKLALRWGYSLEKPTLVIPGNGGIHLTIFYPADSPADPVVINPRGIRAYVRNDIFFKAIPLVLDKIPAARFIGVGMAGDAQAIRWSERLNIAQAVELLPAQTLSEMADLFRRAQVAVSPSTHDGTPNTLLEAMACGCFPVAGDLESLREWITPGENGLLMDPTDPKSVAGALVEALSRPDLRLQAAQINRRIIVERADYDRTMPQAETFYRRIIGK